MSAPRPLPWTDLVEAVGEARFEEIRVALDQAKTDALHRDAFLLNATVGQLLRDLMPPDAPAEAVTAYGALIHMLFACWSRDWPAVPVTAEQLPILVRAPAALHARKPAVVAYVQLPPNQVWAEPAPGEKHEPLDGVFVVAGSQRADALAVLGFRSTRDGFTTMEGAIELPAPPPPPRENGAAPFASALPAGDRKGLLSVVEAHELCALALLALDAAGS